MEFQTYFLGSLNNACHCSCSSRSWDLGILRKKSKKSGDAKMGMSIITDPTIDVNQTKVHVVVFKWNAHLLNRKRKFNVTAYTSK